MAGKVTRVRRRRKIRSFAALGDLGEKFGPRQILLLIAGVIAAFALILFGLTYGARAYHDWHETRLLRRASELLAKKDYSGATEAAQEALEMHRDSLPAYHILAEASEKQNKIDSVAWRAQIARLLPNDTDSQLNLASAALRFGELDTARKALDHVPPNNRDQASYHVVAGWLAHAEGDENGLHEHFAAALKQDPNNELYQFNLAVIEIKSPDQSKRAQARETLDRLTKSVSYRTGALRALLTDAIAEADLQRADALAQELQITQQITLGDYLLCLNLYRKLDEKKFALLLEKVKPVAAHDPVDLAQVMDWMNNNGLATDVLKWVEKLPSSVTTVPPAAISVAEAYAQVKNWSRLRRWTRGSSWRDSEYIRLAYQAYAAHQMRQNGGEAEFESLWRAADHAAADQPAHELTLARLAQKWNLVAESEQLWLRVAKNPPARREAVEALAKIYRANNDMPNLYRAMQRMHEIAPGEPDTAATYARLSLLLDQNTPEGHRIAHEAYEHSPNDTNCAVTYAFSLYGLGRTAEGIDVLKKLPPAQLHDPHAAVYTALLFADENLYDAAREYFEAAQRGPIYPEERKLLEEASAKVPPAVSPSPATGQTGSPAPPASPSPAQSAPPPPASPAGSATPPKPSPAPSPGR